MKKVLSILALCGAGLAANAQTGGFTGPDNRQSVTVAEVAGLPDDTEVRLTGYIVKKLRPNHATILAYTSVFDGAEKMHQVTAKDFRAAAANNVEYGSDMRAGSAGGPLIQDFGDSAAKVKWIGCLSYFTSATGPKVQGASIPDNRFTSLLTQACNHRAGNC